MCVHQHARTQSHSISVCQYCCTSILSYLGLVLRRKYESKKTTSSSRVSTGSVPFMPDNVTKVLSVSNAITMLLISLMVTGELTCR